jgi:hypothetical protein
MKKKLFILLFLLVLCFLQAYEWSVYGLETGEINNMCFLENVNYQEIICASNGFYIFENSEWLLYSYGNLPVWNVYADLSGTGDLIMIMGDGSYSDGVYLFTLDISEFTILEWFTYPAFLLRSEFSGTYYVGGSNGLIKSNDGINWESVTFFEGKNCHAMAIYGEQIIVTANENDIYYSTNNGEEWLESLSNLLITDMDFDQSGKLYAIFPDMSWSSGLWSSDDFGATWFVEFWDNMLSSVFITLEEKIFVGWQEPAANEGLALWDAEQEELHFFNNGLPNLNINTITYCPFIDYPNIICCTDDGSYMLTDYNITSAQENLFGTDFNLKNYPNPFYSATMISFELSAAEAENSQLMIYNVKGQLVKDLSQNLQNNFLEDKSRSDEEYNKFGKIRKYSVSWDGRDDSGILMPSGVYLYKLENERFGQTGKIAYLK